MLNFFSLEAFLLASLVVFGCLWLDTQPLPSRSQERSNFFFPLTRAEAPRHTHTHIEMRGKYMLSRFTAVRHRHIGLLRCRPFCAGGDRREFHIVPMDRVTATRRPNVGDRVFGEGAVPVAGAPGAGAGPAGPESEAEEAHGGPQFALRDEDRDWYDAGVSLEAKDFIAEAEEAYQRSWSALHSVPGGTQAECVEAEVDEQTGEVRRPAKTILTAPFGETMVPGTKVAYALRNMEGELARQQQQRLQQRGEGPPRNEFAALNLRKERQLQALLEASAMPLLAKAEEVRQLLAAEYYPNGVALQRSTGEVVMTLFFHAGLRQRLTGESTQTAVPVLPGWMKGEQAAASFPAATSPPQLPPHPGATSSLSEVSGSSGVELHSGLAGPPPGAAPQAYTFENMPYLSAMRKLYTHQKQHYVAPTSLQMEQLMVTLSAVPAAQQASSNRDAPQRDAVAGGGSRRWRRVSAAGEEPFHLAQRLMIDAYRYVVLPSRTMLTAYIHVCRHHNRMAIALMEVRQALLNLSITLDASMAAALLRGLTSCGQLEEALTIMGRMHRIPLSTELVNACLEALVLSPDPLAAFSTYEACFGRGGARLRPNAESFTLLLLAMDQTGYWGPVRWIAGEMKRYQVRGTPTCLNLLLKGLLKEELNRNAAELHGVMRVKQVPVWPALEEGLSACLGHDKGAGHGGDGYHLPKGKTLLRLVRCGGVDEHNIFLLHKKTHSPSSTPPLPLSLSLSGCWTRPTTIASKRLSQHETISLMNATVKPEIKQEQKPHSPEDPYRLSSSGGGAYATLDAFEPVEPGAVYTCGNCTREIFLTAGSPMQCPSCEHITGSSSVFYKIRTQATTYDTI
eukprot:gene12937-8793_t